MPKVSFVSGAGGTGKTTLMRYICETHQELEVLSMDDLPAVSAIQQDRWYLLPSQTRRFYAELAVATEKEFATKQVNAQYLFQEKLMTLYQQDLSILEELILKNGGNLLLERSYLDHAAYAALTINHMNAAGEDSTEAALRTMEFAMVIHARFDEYENRHHYTPYPPFWGTDAGEDGFRNTNHDKNVAWDTNLKMLAIALGLRFRYLNLADYVECYKSIFYLTP